MTRRHPPHIGPKLGSYEALVEEVAIRRGLPKTTTRQVLADFVAALAKTVWECERVEVPGLGVFRVHTHAARRIRHPETKRLMKLPALRMAKLRVSGEWRTSRTGGK